MSHPLSLLAPATLAALISTLAGAAAPPNDARLQGFGAERASAQRKLEERFDAAIDTNDQREWLRNLASAPNHVGSPHDKANAEFVQAKFREWGWDARIEVFDVLYPTLKSHAVELVEPTTFKARLDEPPVDGDATSSKTGGAIPPYNAYGGDGDVTAPLVYVNYGMPDDYLELARHGVDVKGKIVIARYGSGWRGLKPKLAQAHGAVGCIIYSDPHGDGYFEGETYPKGAFRPADGVQRGSVADMPVYPGDPLTPGVGSTKNAKRLALADAKTILKIPVLPISYGDAQPLLSALTGPVAPTHWRGALPITYHIGPGAAKVHLAVQSNWDRKPLYDVIATLRGREAPDEWIVRGNHRDAWVFGADDPLSGTIAMLAEAKAIGALVKQGWHPRRTIVFASWDGEEPGLLGSTEWAETHADELQRKAVLYLNTDGNARGFFSAAGSHSLQRLVNEAAASVIDPETKVSVRERLRAKMRVDGYAKGAEEEAKKAAKIADGGGDLPIGALGSGSDFTPFLQHLGVASLNLSFEGESTSDGVYHSIYDSFDHFVRFIDPDFAYSKALAQVSGRVVMRSADADLVPMHAGDVATTVSEYVDEVKKLADTTRDRSAALTKLLDAKAFALASNPTDPLLAPVAEDVVPAFDFAPLEQARDRLQAKAKAFDDALDARAADGKLSAAQRAAVDRALLALEQTLTDARGLPGREWYRHLLYAPGLYTGYGVKTLPGVREGIEQRQWEQTKTYIAATAAVIDRYGEGLDRATKLLQP